MRRYLIPLVLALALVIGAATLVSAQTAKPNGYCWERTFDGFYDTEVVRFILTDVSNPVWARWLAINYAPRLGLIDYDIDGVGDMFFVTNYPQLVVFSTQRGESDYTPIWDIDLVTWVDPNDAYPLTSEAEVLAAEGAGDVDVVESGVIIDAPIVEDDDGNYIPQSTQGSWIGPPYRFFGGGRFIRLPIYNGYVDNRQVTFLKTDFADEDLADEYGGNYAPDLDEFSGDSDVLDVRYRWLVDLESDPPLGVCPANQWSVYGESVSPVGWRNRNWWYTPLREHITIFRTNMNDYSNIYRNADFVEFLLGNGTLDVDSEDGVVNSPTIVIPYGNTLKYWR